MAQEFKALFCMLGLAFFLSQPMHSCLAAENNNGMKLSRRLSVIHERLRAINKTPIKSIQSSDGDVIDCIPRHQQLGLEHPMLKNHKIKDLPTRPTSATKATANRSYAGLNAFQIWHLSGISCPGGTIPVRRTTVNDLMRFDSLEQYGRKPKYSNISSSQKPIVISGNGHEHAIAYLKGGEYFGAKATMNVWNPHIGASNEFSLSQMWVLSGSFDGSDLNSIEAGWQVSPVLYGDHRPRFFTYWTSDSYQETGCYNLLCSGFIQTNERIAIGAAITPISSFNGPQYDITILIWKDPKQGDWWMEFAENELVGYWPAHLFTHLTDHANMVEWGGEVVNMEPGGDHTSTQMGSGHFPNEGFGRASYFRNLQVVDAENSLQTIDSVSTLSEHTTCYDIQSVYNDDWGNHFYFGGPGQNSQCP